MHEQYLSHAIALSPVMETRHLLEVEFSIKKASSQVPFRDDLTVLYLFIRQLSSKSAVPRELTRETTERSASETDRVNKRYLTKHFNCLSL